MVNLFDLTGKKAVVIGGGGGLGSAAAQGLMEHGAQVMIGGRTISTLEETVEDIYKAVDQKPHIHQVNICDPESVQKLCDDAISTMGGVDILVNSAGYTKKTKALEETLTEWDAHYDINVRGFFITSQIFGRVFCAQQSGKVIHMSSVRGIRANAGGNTAYCSTKGALDMMTRCMATEWAPYHVNVNAIGPALTFTKLTSTHMKEPGRVEGYTKNIPMGRLGEVADITGAVIYLASAASDFVTGQIIYVDGGLTAIG